MSSAAAGTPFKRPKGDGSRQYQERYNEAVTGLFGSGSGSTSHHQAPSMNSHHTSSSSQGNDAIPVRTGKPPAAPPQQPIRALSVSGSGSGSPTSNLPMTGTTTAATLTPQPQPSHPAAAAVASAQSRLQQLYLQHQLTPTSALVATPTSTTANANAGSTPNTEGLEGGGEPSYDYYMECANNNPNNSTLHQLLNRSVGANTLDGTNTVTTNTLLNNTIGTLNNTLHTNTLLHIPPSPSNGNDTFEDLWQDEMEEDVEDDYTAADGTTTTTYTDDGSASTGNCLSAKQKRNWKARAVTALLEQQLREAQKVFRSSSSTTPTGGATATTVGKPPMHTGPSPGTQQQPQQQQVLVGASASSPAWFSPQPSATNATTATTPGHAGFTLDSSRDGSAAGSSLQSVPMLPRNGGTILDTSGSVIAAAGTTPHTVVEEGPDDDLEPSPIKSSSNNDSLNQSSLPTTNDSSGQINVSYHSSAASPTRSINQSLDQIDELAASNHPLFATTTSTTNNNNNIVVQQKPAQAQPSSQSGGQSNNINNNKGHSKKKKNKKSSILLKASDHDTPSLQQSLEDQYQVIRRTKSSPPDPPSYKFLSSSPPSASSRHQQQQISAYLRSRSGSRSIAIPNATTTVGSTYYYDPDEEEDALTNLVITVVGLEGQDGEEEEGDEEDQPEDDLIAASNTTEHQEAVRRNNNKRKQAAKRHGIRQTKSGLTHLLSPSSVAGAGDGNNTPSFVDYAAARAAADTSQVSSSPTMSASFRTGLSSGSSSNQGSFQTLFLTADATSGILFGALIVLMIPLVVYGMMLWELLDNSNHQAQAHQQPSMVEDWQEFFHIPMNEDVHLPVRITQLCLLLGWILLVHQAALVHTTLQLVVGLSDCCCGCCCALTRRQKQRRRYANLSTSFFSNTAVVHPSSTSNVAVVSRLRWMIGTLLEWLKQVLYMVTSLLVLLQASDSVQTLLWNMGALEFVLRLDVLSFLVWSRMGYYHSLATRHLILPGAANEMRIHPIMTPPTEDTDGSGNHHHHHHHRHDNKGDRSNQDAANTNAPSAITGSATTSESQQRMARYQRRYHRRRQEESPASGSTSHLRSKATTYNVSSFPPIQSNDYPLLRILLYFVISSAILMVYGGVVYEQVLGHPVELKCHAIAVQFGDVLVPAASSSRLQVDSSHYYYASFLSGIYTQRQGQFIRHHGRHIFDFVKDPRRSKSSSGSKTPFKIAYCRPLQAWTLSRETANPCLDYLLRTSPTQAYDPLSLAQSVSWFVMSRTPEALEAPLDSFHVACADCVHGMGRARSSAAFGYQCIMDQASITNALQIEDGNSTVKGPSSPCSNLTWDRRHGPFPDVIWQPPTVDSKTSLPDYFDDEASTITAGVDSHEFLEIVVDASGNMLKEPHFQRPVYFSQFDDNLVLVCFIGRRWVIVQLRKDFIFTWRSHPERHMEKLTSLYSKFEEDWISRGSDTNDSKEAPPEIVPIFVSEPVSLSVQESHYATPAGLQWYKVQQSHKTMSGRGTLRVGDAIDAVLHCAVCDVVSNPCHSGGFCHQDDETKHSGSARGGQCICRPGFEGFLCESTSLGCHTGESFVGLCFHEGTCGSSGECNCPLWKRNQRAFPVRGDVCQYLPNCWEFEDDGMACFEKETCSNVGCDNGGTCKVDGTCDCDGTEWATSEDTGRFRGKLCQEEVNCYDYEEDGKDCVEKGTCSNLFCNGGICSADGSCQKCPMLAFGRFCQVLPDCFNFEIGGASTDCFDTGRCTNLGCANGGVCQRDGTCSCEGDPEDQDEGEDKDPFYDDDTLLAAEDSNVWYSGKLCQMVHGQGEGGQNGEELDSSSCILSACQANGGQCSTEGVCECPMGLSGAECEIVSDCFEMEADGKNCFALGTCTSSACHLRTSNSTCREDGQCECPELGDEEVYGKLCHKVWPIDDCFEAEEHGKDCLKLGTCTNTGCLNGGTCTTDGSCDCTSLFWGKQCQHARNCFEQEYSCFFNTFLTGSGQPNENIDPTKTPCSDAGCLNNGICQASGDCLCPGGFSGKICQDTVP